jgi:hypothetical protein
MAEKRIEPKAPQTDEPAAGARKAERETAKKNRTLAKKNRTLAKKNRTLAKKSRSF